MAAQLTGSACKSLATNPKRLCWLDVRGKWAKCALRATGLFMAKSMAQNPHRHAYARVCACARARVRARVHVRVCARVCVRARGRARTQVRGGGQAGAGRRARARVGVPLMQPSPRSTCHEKTPWQARQGPGKARGRGSHGPRPPKPATTRPPPPASCARFNKLYLPLTLHRRARPALLPSP